MYGPFHDDHAIKKPNSGRDSQHNIYIKCAEKPSTTTIAYKACPRRNRGTNYMQWFMRDVISCVTSKHDI